MFSGSMVALVTPMDERGDVDLAALKRLIEWHIESGTQAIVVLGTTGESTTLSADERAAIIDAAVATADKRVPIIVGTGTNCTRTSILNSQQAQAAGAAGCLVVTPYYNKPTQHGLVAHFKAIAQAVTIPVILYNVPGRTSCDLLPETAAQLAEVENIVAIKEATGDVGRGSAVLAACGDKITLLSGDDATGLALMQVGAKGVISVTANVAPKVMRELCDAMMRGDDVLAMKCNEKLEALHTALFVESNPIPVKWVLAQLGHIGEGIRLPLTPLSEEKQAVVEAAMRSAELERSAG